MTEVYLGRVRHSCAVPHQVIETDDKTFGGKCISPDHLPDGRRLAVGMRWRCPICWALWGVKQPYANVFVPQWFKLSSGFGWRVVGFLAPWLLRRRLADKAVDGDG